MMQVQEHRLDHYDDMRDFYKRYPQAEVINVCQEVRYRRDYQTKSDGSAHIVQTTPEYSYRIFFKDHSKP